MSGGSTPEKTVQQSSASSTPNLGYGALKGILGAANGLLPQASQINPLQQQGLNSLAGAAQQSGQYAPNIQALTQSLFNGGGYGTGVQGIQQATQNAQNNLTPYANGSNLDPTTNPAYASLLQSLKSTVNNNVGGQFAAAGREFSPAQAGATATGLTNALAPYMFGQYNQNVASQMGANQQLVGNAQNASSAYDQSAGNQLNAQLQAPGSLMNSAIPGNMQLSAGGAPLQTSANNLGTLSNLVLPIAQGGGTSQTGTDNTTKTPAQGSTLQQIMGGLAGGVGILGQTGAFPSAGTNGGAASAGWLGPAMGTLMFSDKRLKENIREVGALHDGQKIYAFNFKGDPRTTVGLMAQEVLEKCPGAVVVRPDGLLMVDYNLATAQCL